MKQVVKSIVRHESSLSTAVPWNLEDLRDGLGSPTRVITGRSRLARRFASRRACRLNCVGSLVQIVNPLLRELLMLHEPVEHRPAMVRDELCLLDGPGIDWRTARWKKWCLDDSSIFHEILFMGLLLFCSQLLLNLLFENRRLG